MTNEELKALCESNARAIAATNEGINGLRTQQEASTANIINLTTQQETNTANITDLITLSGNVLRAVDGLIAKIDESNQRFEVLRNDAIADRRTADRRTEESNRRFDAQMEAMRSQLLEMSRMNRRIDDLEQAS